TLTIDNADQRLNVEFNEIEVARRLYRSGESEYLINGARARLKDIDALLASTGLRQDGYAVTAQNDIDFVIQAAPALRRELIEEAAGVRRLRDQRQEAINRLAEADRDMRRARDILNELSPRAEELRLQAASAEEYKKVADALKALQGSLARIAQERNAAAVQALEALQSELQRLNASEQAGSRVVDELARAAESARADLETANSALEAAADAERAARERQAKLEADRLARQ